MPDIMGYIQQAGEMLGETVGTKSVEKFSEIENAYKQGKISEDEKKIRQNNLKDEIEISVSDVFKIPAQNRFENIKKAFVYIWNRYKYILYIAILLILGLIIAYIFRTFKKVN